MNPPFDAIVVYQNDWPIGVYDSWEEASAATGVSVIGLKHLSYPSYHKEYDAIRDKGKGRDGYLVQGVRL